MLNFSDASANLTPRQNEAVTLLFSTHYGIPDHHSLPHTIPPYGGFLFAICP
ncbi:MAG: hypothetical protein IJ351_01040 [Oscillospiraceae bacterium]|nr:hypothetical protein [Oscillospiraceae bacterium]